jgi:hypothetical protein
MLLDQTTVSGSENARFSGKPGKFRHGRPLVINFDFAKPVILSSFSLPLVIMASTLCVCVGGGGGDQQSSSTHIREILGDLFICLPMGWLEGSMNSEIPCHLQIPADFYHIWTHSKQPHTLKHIRYGNCHGRDSSVGIATRYGLDGPEIECRLAARFSATVQTSTWTHTASCTMGAGSLFPGVKWTGRGVNHPPLSNPEVKERVEL